MKMVLQWQVKAGSNYWQGMEAVMEWNWFYRPLTLKRIIKGQIVLFENCFGFALRPHFPWAVLCFWQPPLAQELPDAFAELSLDFMKKSDTSSQLSFSLSPEIWLVSQSDVPQSLSWLLPYFFLCGHFVSDPDWHKSSCLILLCWLWLEKETHIQTYAYHKFPGRSVQEPVKRGVGELMILGGTGEWYLARGTRESEFYL